GKSAEIVNRPRCGTDRDSGSRNEPVRGNGENRFGSWRLKAEALPTCCIRILRQRVHRIAVSKEYGWKHAMLLHLGPRRPRPKFTTYPALTARAFSPKRRSGPSSLVEKPSCPRSRCYQQYRRILHSPGEKLRVGLAWGHPGTPKYCANAVGPSKCQAHRRKLPRCRPACLPKRFGHMDATRDQSHS